MPSIILTIEDEFKVGFLAHHPIPLILDPSKPDDLSAFIPEFTEDDWVKEYTIRILMGEYRNGKDKFAKDSIVYGKNLIQ